MPARPATASATGPPASSRTSRPPRICGTRSSSSASASASPSAAELGLQGDEVALDEGVHEQLDGVGLDAVGAQQHRKQRGVAEADPEVAQADRVERVGEHRERLRRSLRRGRADELDPGLKELAHLAAVRAHAAVGVGEVAEAQRGLGVLIARADEPRDRHRHVRAQREHLAVVVEHAVRGRRPTAAGEHVLVLERRGPHLAVAVVFEDAADGLGDVAQLAHLVGQHVASAGGNGMDLGAHGCSESRRPDAAYVGRGRASSERRARWRRARCERRGRAGARRCARSRGRSGRCCRSPSGPPRTARR